MRPKEGVENSSAFILENQRNGLTKNPTYGNVRRLDLGCSFESPVYPEILLEAVQKHPILNDKQGSRETSRVLYGP
jgi:hypothetical protein